MMADSLINLHTVLHNEKDIFANGLKRKNKQTELPLDLPPVVPRQHLKDEPDKGKDRGTWARFQDL